MPEVEDEVRIADLEKSCDYLRFRFTTDAPQPCGQPATSLVLVPDAPRQGGKPKFRCDDHEGWLLPGERGEMVKAMPRALAEGWLL